MRYFIHTDDQVLWEVPPGKPDSSYPFPGINVDDTRPRVSDPGQKGGASCEYYAFNFFRPRIGKHPDSNPELRRVEQLFSEHRKVVSRLIAERETLLQQAEGMMHALGPKPSNDDFRKLIALIGAKKGTEIVEAHEKLLASVDFDLEAYAASLCQKYQLPSYAESLVAAKQLISGLAIMHARLTQYPHLCISSWNITKGPDVLMQEIKQFGPMLVKGYYGSDFYRPNSAFVMKEPIGEQAIHAWRSRDYVWQKAATHTIAVVGMKKEESGKYRVIFIDPRDASKPDEPRKHYLMSYERFIENMRDLHGTQAVKTELPGSECLIRCSNSNLI